MMNTVLDLQKLVPDTEGKDQALNATITTITTVTTTVGRSSVSLICKKYPITYRK
ncbi:class III lanthipeptide [Lysinibacillus sp. CD3-6]|uniref:class III lanthipeptide n=1 Tax=Lysinibacillus sp. CD3-6 TaxID=2892541 RepID=UPI001D17BEB1|nr:class III lanthipeptide [Lysinibacillus sp. CD3-6]UED81664.1 class III lanthipeptide [Lysinibacillus sp. CD3-6]